MWIRRPAVLHAATGFFAAVLVFAAAIPARAETGDLQACATQYQAAKADNKLNGQAWQDFYADCKAKVAAAAPKSEAPEAAAPAAAAPTPKAEADKAEAPKTEAAPAQAAAGADAHAQPSKDDKAVMEAREKKCRAEWKAEAPELKKKDPKATWNKYSKQCNARL
jgi:hypothetical protein